MRINGYVIILILASYTAARSAAARIRFAVTRQGSPAPFGSRRWNYQLTYRPITASPRPGRCSCVAVSLQTYLQAELQAPEDVMFPRETQHRILNLAPAGAVASSGPSEASLARWLASSGAKPVSRGACRQLRQSGVAGWVQGGVAACWLTIPGGATGTSGALGHPALFLTSNYD